MRPNDNKYGYEGKVSFENTKKLQDNGYKSDRTFKSGWDYNDKGGYASAIDLEYNGKVFKAPTFGEAFDFLRNKGVIITLIPCFTFALKDHTAYHYRIDFHNEQTAALEKVVESPDCGSFNLMAEEAISKALELCW